MSNTKRETALVNLKRAWNSGSGCHGFIKRGFHMRCDRCALARAGQCKVAGDGEREPCKVLPVLQAEWYAALCPDSEEKDPRRGLLVSEFLQYKSLLWVLHSWLSVTMPLYAVKGVVRCQPTLGKEALQWSKHALAVLRQLEEYDKEHRPASKVDHAKVLSAEFETVDGGE